MIIFIIISIAYLLLVVSLSYGWRQIPVYTPDFSPAHTQFSIIIPFRNEAGKLPLLFESLVELKYPTDKFEIFLVNDESEDNSLEICERFRRKHPRLNIGVLQNDRQSNSPKKDAITTAVKRANYPYILTTDADCQVPEFWLQTFNDFLLKNNCQLVAGPVAISRVQPTGSKKNRKSFLVFEELDILSLQAATAGAFGLNKPFMCNGANLCYQTEMFKRAGGFRGNDGIASGDDVFLLQKFSNLNYKVAFLKSTEAIVHTQPQKSLRSLILQRIRWATKAPAYQSLFSQFSGITVLLMNAGLLFGATMTFLEIWSYYPVLIIFLLKFNVDFALIYLSAKFFKREEVLHSYFWSSLVYPIFSSFVAIKALISGYQWKGRNFRK
ncbi:glycosyltransferase [Salegentibacter sp. F14]